MGVSGHQTPLAMRRRTVLSIEGWGVGRTALKIHVVWYMQVIGRCKHTNITLRHLIFQLQFKTLFRVYRVYSSTL